MNQIALKELCYLTMGQSPSSDNYNDEQVGYPFYQGNADFGKLHPCTRMWCDKPKKLAKKDDILISVRAPIGALNIATEDCCIGRGLAAITVNPSKSNMLYIFYALTAYNKLLQNQGTGSTFKAINKNSLEELLLPDYSIEKQAEIAHVLQKVDQLIDIRSEQLSKLDELVKSRFIEMFGDPVTNPNKWTIKKLKELGELARGVSKYRPRNAPELLNGPYPLIQTGEVSASDLFITNYSMTYSEKGLAQSRMWPIGTLCITIAANIAQTGILSFKSCFPDSVVGFIPGNFINNIFLHYWFSFLQWIIETKATQVAQKNINLQVLGDLEVIVPEIHLQNEFADFVKVTDKSKTAIQKSLDDLETLKKSLMQQYFA